MNERTKWFFNDWCKYRAGLREIWASFDQGMKELEPMKGSKHYIERCEELTTERDNAIHNLQTEFRNEFSLTIEGMRASATTRPANPPSADQLAILQALNMRQKVSIEDLEMAEQSMTGNDLAITDKDAISLIESALRQVADGTAEGTPLQDEKYGYYMDPPTMRQYTFDGFSIVAGK